MLNGLYKFTHLLTHLLTYFDTVGRVMGTAFCRQKTCAIFYHLKSTQRLALSLSTGFTTVL